MYACKTTFITFDSYYFTYTIKLDMNLNQRYCSKKCWSNGPILKRCWKTPPQASTLQATWWYNSQKVRNQVWPKLELSSMNRCCCLLSFYFKFNEVWNVSQIDLFEVGCWHITLRPKKINRLVGVSLSYVFLRGKPNFFIAFSVIFRQAQFKSKHLPCKVYVKNIRKLKKINCLPYLFFKPWNQNQTFIFFLGLSYMMAWFTFRRESGLTLTWT